MARHDRRLARAYNLAQLWIGWMDVHRFFAPPEQKNILAMMMAEPTRSNGEPDGELSADILAFNLSVVSLKKEKFIPFIVVYCDYKPRPIKQMSYELGIDPSTFYDWAHSTAQQVLNETDRLVRMHNQMRNELEGLC